jgi:hypothetical protein
VQVEVYWDLNFSVSILASSFASLLMQDVLLIYFFESKSFLPSYNINPAPQTPLLQRSYILFRQHSKPHVWLISCQQDLISS